MIALQQRPLFTQAFAAATLIALCVFTGLVVSVSPKMGAGVVFAGAFGSLFLLGLSPTKVFLNALVVLLVAYVFLARGAASIGFGPIYVGEMVFALAALQLFVIFPTIRLTTMHWLIVGFMIYGLLRTLPFVGVYGVDAFRDAVMWGYALFALVVSFTITRSHLEGIHAAVQRWLPWIITLGAASYAVHLSIGPSLPSPPGSDLPILFIRAGEMAVHLAGMAAFLILGLYSDTSSEDGRRGRGETLLYAVVILGLLVLSAFSRGAFLTIGITVFVAFLFKPSVRFFQFLAVGALLLPVLLVVQPTFKFGAREFSAKQITENVTSLFSPQGGTELAGTRNFREEWWDEIISYTFHGPYFWGGKGFGVNLADDDGFQVLADGSLRSPHNGHLNFLARMGVPGFMLWLTILSVFVITMVRARQLFLRRGDTLLAGLAAWILVYWLAAATNASFDVYIEGPQGGIWFWSLIGAGIALAGLAHAPGSQAIPAAPAQRSGTLTED